MNILLSSVGRRGYLVKYFKEALRADGQVWGADNSACSPAFAYCDGTAIVPQVKNGNYPQVLLQICQTHRIDIVIPLIDPELEVLAACQKTFAEAGVMLLVSPESTIRTAFDKYLTWQFAQSNGLAAPQTFIDVNQALEQLQAGTLKWPVVVKARKGSASIDITDCYDKLQLQAAFEATPDPMIQEILTGDEYGYDLFGGADCQPISVYCKKKLAMRAGETDKAISTDDRRLIDFGQKILNCLPIYGPCDLDVFMTDQGPKLLEINPRFGGGYPCSHMAGADFPNKIIALRKDRPLTPDIGACPDGVCMLKQDEIIRPEWDINS